MKNELKKKLFGHVSRDERAEKMRNRLDPYLNDWVAPIIFEFTDKVLPEFAELGVILESGNIDHIAETAGADYAERCKLMGDTMWDAVRKLESELKSSSDKDLKELGERVRGFMDGWAKDIANRCYGPAEPVFYEKYGDQTDNFMCLVFPGQERKHSAIKLILEYVGHETDVRKDITSESKRAIAPFVGDARKLLDEDWNNLDSKKKSVIRSKYKSVTEYLAALDLNKVECRVDEQTLREVGGAIRYLENWIEGKDRRRHPEGKKSNPGKFNPVAVGKPAEVSATDIDPINGKPKPENLLRALKRVGKKADGEVATALGEAVKAAEVLIPLAKTKGEDISLLLVEAVEAAKARNVGRLSASFSAMVAMAESMR